MVVFLVFQQQQVHHNCKHMKRHHRLFVDLLCATAATAALLPPLIHSLPVEFPEVYQVNSSALLGEGLDSLLSGKLLVHLEDGRKHQVVGMFVVDSGCRGLELDLVLTKSKAESLGLQPFEGPGRHPVVLPGRAANRSPMPLVKMWPQVIMLVPLYRRGTGPVAALRKSNLTVWAADIDIVDGRRRGGSEGGIDVINMVGEEEEIWDAVAWSSSSVDEEVLTANQEFDGDGYQALHSPVTEDKHIALLGKSGLAKLGLRADFAHNLVYSVQTRAVIASMHSM